MVQLSLEGTVWNFCLNSLRWSRWVAPAQFYRNEQERGLDPTRKWSRGELTVIRTSKRIASDFRNGLLSQNPVGISEPEWKKNHDVLCHGCQHWSNEFCQVRILSCTSLTHSWNQKIQRKITVGTQGDVIWGRRSGHITGQALGMVRLGPTSCYQHWGLPAGNSCFPLHIFLPSTWARCP